MIVEELLQNELSIRNIGKRETITNPSKYRVNDLIDNEYYKERALTF